MKQASQLRFPWLWAAVAAFGLAACGERVDQGASPDQAAERIGQSERAPGMRPGDAPRDGGATAGGAPMPDATAPADTAALGNAVKSTLSRDPQLGAAPIEVEVAGGGQVALKGEAPTASAKERAAQLAWTVKGVTKVDNQLTVHGS